MDTFFTNKCVLFSGPSLSGSRVTLESRWRACLCGVAGGLNRGTGARPLRVLLPYILARSAHRPATWREAEWQDALAPPRPPVPSASPCRAARAQARPGGRVRTDWSDSRGRSPGRAEGRATVHEGLWPPTSSRTRTRAAPAPERAVGGWGAALTARCRAHGPGRRASHPAPAPAVPPAGRPTCSSLSEYFWGFLLPWLFLRSFFSSAWHLSSASPRLRCSVWYFFSAACGRPHGSHEPPARGSRRPRSGWGR